jgi:MoaA/NifB/PqqE/SkfB family radical SAM enzyme
MASLLQIKVKRAKVLAGILTGARPLTGPRFVLFRINHTCNMKCLMCASFSELVPPEHRIDTRSDMSFELYKQLIDECTALEVERVSVGGEGEPSLHKSFFDMLAYAKSKGLEGTTITNGAMLTKKNAERIVEMQWDELNVSMNAGNQAAHERVTVTRTWERIREGLLYIAELKRAKDLSRPKVRLSNTIFNTNYTSIVDMVRFAIETSADEMTVGLATLDDYPNDGRHVLALDSEQFRETKRLLAEGAALAASAPALTTNIQTFHDTIDRETTQLRITESVQMQIPCTVGHWLAVIDPDGEVHACCQCEPSLGNASAASGSSFRDVWHGKAYAEFRDAARHLPDRKGEAIDGCTCHSCDFTPANLAYYNKLHPWKPVTSLRVSPRR